MVTLLCITDYDQKILRLPISPNILHEPLVKELMEKTSTQTGLKAFVHIIDQVYETGRKVAAGFKDNMRIVFDDFLPQWNYRALPPALANAQVI